MPLNPLGVPETEADWQFVVETIARRSPVPPVGADLERVHVAFPNSLARDMQLMEATGRWLFSRAPNRQPTEYVPGDVLALRPCGHPYPPGRAAPDGAALDLLTAIVAWGDWHPPAEPIEVSPE